MSLFGAPASNSNSLCQMKAGKMTLAGTTVTSDSRKGLLVLRKSDDGLMHLIWQDRASGSVEDDLIVFPGDAMLRHLPACKDGFAMVLEFNTGRKLFFWSQEMRKKGSDWTKSEDNAKENELLAKANGYLSGGSGPSPAAAPASASGFGGMTHAELMAMLSGPAVMPPPATAPVPAPTTSTAESAPGQADAAATSEPSASSPAPALAAPFSSDAISNILGGVNTTAQPPAATIPTSAPEAAPTATQGFSADAISSILSNIPPAPAGVPAAASPATPGFTASNISNILGNIAAQNAPVALNEVIRPESTAAVVDPSMEARLAQHLPSAGDDVSLPETVTGTLSTPQLQQAAARFTEALNQGEAAGLIAEMGLNPSGLGVEPFLRSLQEATDAGNAGATQSAMDVESTADDSTAGPTADPAPEKMDES